MQTLRWIATVTALLITTGKADCCPAGDVAGASATSPQVVEVDDLVLPEGLIKKFDLDELPKAIRELDGRRVRIHASIGLLPTDEAVSHAIVYGETQGRVYHVGYSNKPVQLMIATKLRSPQAFKFEASIVVEGVFRVRPVIRDSKLKLLYFLEDAVATPSKLRDGYRRSVGWGC